MGNPGQTIQPYRGIVSERVASVLRSTEIHPLEIRFVSSFVSKEDRLLSSGFSQEPTPGTGKIGRLPVQWGSPKTGAGFGWLPPLRRPGVPLSIPGGRPARPTDPPGAGDWGCLGAAPSARGLLVP